MNREIALDIDFSLPESASLIFVRERWHAAGMKTRVEVVEIFTLSARHGACFCLSIKIPATPCLHPGIRLVSSGSADTAACGRDDV